MKVLAILRRELGALALAVVVLPVLAVLFVIAEGVALLDFVGLMPHGNPGFPTEDPLGIMTSSAGATSEIESAGESER